MSEQRKWTLFWRTGDREVVSGKHIAEAMMLAGYGGGAYRALDFYAKGDSTEYQWNSVSREWDPVAGPVEELPMTEDVKDLAMKAARAVEERIIERNDGGLIDPGPEEMAGLIQRVIEPAIVAAREEAERFRYTSDKQTVAWKERALAAEQREAALRAEMDEYQKMMVSRVNQAERERDALKAEREEVNARLQSQAKVLGQIASGICECEEWGEPKGSCYPCMARAAREIPQDAAALGAQPSAERPTLSAEGNNESAVGRSDGDGQAVEPLVQGSAGGDGVSVRGSANPGRYLQDAVGVGENARAGVQGNRQGRARARESDPLAAPAVPSEVDALRAALVNATVMLRRLLEKPVRWSAATDYAIEQVLTQADAALASAPAKAEPGKEPCKHERVRYRICMECGADVEDGWAGGTPHAPAPPVDKIEERKA